MSNHKDEKFSWDITILDVLKDSKLPEIDRDNQILKLIKKSMDGKNYGAAYLTEFAFRIGDATKYLNFWPNFSSPLHPYKTRPMVKNLK